MGLLGLVAAVRAFKQAGLVKQLALLQPVTARQARPGLVMVKGKFTSDTLLQSPLQGRACHYYFFRATEPRPGKKPRLLATGKDWADVRLDDGYQGLPVTARTALISSPRRHEERFQNLQSIPPGREEFFEKAGIDPKHLPRLPSFLVHEFTIEPGDELYVTGTLVDDEAGPRITRVKRGPLFIGADPSMPFITGLRNEFVLYAAIAPILLLGAIALATLAFTIS